MTEELSISDESVLHDIVPAGLNEEETVTYLRLWIRLRGAEQQKLELLVESLVKRIG